MTRVTLQTDTAIGRVIRKLEETVETKRGTRRVAVKIRSNREFVEYQCELYLDGRIRDAATYYTDDYADAFGTATLMLKNEVLRIRRPTETA